MSLLTGLPPPPRLSGLGSIKLRRAAIARYVRGQPPAVPRAWLDVLLKRARSGDADARSSLLAWASALLPARDVGLTLELRSLDEGLSDDDNLSPVTVAYVRATAAPSEARRLSPRVRLGGDEHSEASMLSGWHIVEVGCRQRYRSDSQAEVTGEPIRPWLAHLNAAERDALSPDEADALWAAWEAQPDDGFDDRVWFHHTRSGRGPLYLWRSRRVPALRHPSLSLRRKLLAEPALEEREVLWLASQRPTRAGLLLAIADDDRWFFRPRVRAALAQNPYTPSWLVAAILPIASRDVQRELARRHDAPVVVDLARALLDTRG